VLVKTKKPGLEERPPEELLKLHGEVAGKFASLRKQPRVGIFWYHKRKVLGDFSDFATAEIYGNIVGPRTSHYDYWPKIQARNSELAHEEYEYTPRGRVLYDLIQGSFVIISSKAIIKNEAAIKALKAKCNIPLRAHLTLKSDLHYENPADIDWE
jgi:hypothetical protein